MLHKPREVTWKKLFSAKVTPPRKILLQILFWVRTKTIDVLVFVEIFLQFYFRIYNLHGVFNEQYSQWILLFQEVEILVKKDRKVNSCEFLCFNRYVSRSIRHKNFSIRHDKIIYFNLLSDKFYTTNKPTSNDSPRSQIRATDDWGTSIFYNQLIIFE